MFKNIFILLMCFICLMVNICYSQIIPTGNYKYRTSWVGFTGTDEPAPEGFYYVDVKIFQKENKLFIEFEKSMDPPGTVFMFTTELLKDKNQYTFQFTDNFEGTGKGILRYQDNKLLYILTEEIDTESAAMIGIGRLYGDDLLIKISDTAEKEYNFLGETLYSNKQYEEAKEIFQVLSDTFPDNEKAAGNYCITLIKVGDYETAEFISKDIIKKSTDVKTKSEAYYNLGLSFDKRGMKDKALESYTKSIELRPNKNVQNTINNLNSIVANNSSLAGKWEWEGNNDRSMFTITIELKNDFYFGKYCAVMYSGNKIDCDIDEYSFKFKSFKEEVTFDYICNFSGENGKAKISNLGDKIKWEILDLPDGECYAPKNAILTRSKKD
jgi:tetratricopeptide (TPR) repeat protein